MSIWVPTPQLVQRLRDAGYRFKRQADRVQIYKESGSTRRVNVPRRDFVTDNDARAILRNAGLTDGQVEKFLEDVVAN